MSGNLPLSDLLELGYALTLGLPRAGSQLILRRMRNEPVEVHQDPAARDLEFMRPLVDAARFLGKKWFRTVVEGIEEVPGEGPVLLVGNHNGGVTISDTILTMVALWDGLDPQRAPYLLAHDFVFQDSSTRRCASRFGFLSASHESSRRVFALGKIALVYPGSDNDSMRSFFHRDRVFLGGRTGFIRLALRERVPIVPVVSAGAQETYIVLTRGARLAKAMGTERWLRSSSFPIVLSWPLGLTSGWLPYVPLPSQITIRFGRKIEWPDLAPGQADDDEVVAACYREVHAVMQGMADSLYEGRVPWLGKKISRRSR
jgi:1-acyl-sn-glycerol-3-phosphate acyltransferase